MPKNRWEKLKKLISQAREASDRARSKRIDHSNSQEAAQQESEGKSDRVENQVEVDAEAASKKDKDAQKKIATETKAENRSKITHNKKKKQTEKNHYSEHEADVKPKKSDEKMKAKKMVAKTEANKKLKKDVSEPIAESCTSDESKLGTNLESQEQQFLESSDDDSSADGGKTHPKEKRYAEPDAKTTIFCTNLPFEATSKDLFSVFKEYGHIKYANIVMDKVLGRSKGRAFIQFATKDAATKAIEDGKPEGAIRTRVSQKAQKKVTQLISESSGIEILGRRIFVFMAQTRENVAKARARDNEDVDKRNFNLLQHGLEITPGLSKKELIKRETLLEDKRRRLRNPNLFISKTRLVVRNLPKTLNDKELKGHFSTRAGVIRREKKNKGYDLKIAKITQAKVCRSKEVDNWGSSASLRYGFVQFREHTDAMACLQYYNTNVFENSHRIRVEFSIENSLILNARKDRFKRDRKMAKIATRKRIKEQQEEDRDDESNLNPKKSKSKKRWRDVGKPKRNKKRSRKSSLLRVKKRSRK